MAMTDMPIPMLLVGVKSLFLQEVNYFVILPKSVHDICQVVSHLQTPDDSGWQTL